VRRLARQLSIVIVYSPDTEIQSVERVLEGVFGSELDISDNSRVGNVHACVIDVRVPDGFEVRAARRRIREELPAVRIKIIERFRESWWARPRWAIAIGAGVGIGVGVALVFISELLRPLVERMREALG